MAYCTLQEAWGQDYKSFLSPASLSPDWLEQCRQKRQKDSNGLNAPSGFSSERDRTFHYSGLDETTSSLVEQFDGGNKGLSRPKTLLSRNEDEDSDLLVQHDEFNVPMHFEAPEAIDPGLDDYYKLIDSEYDKDTINSYHYPYQDTNYAEELQLNHKCATILPNKIKYHLKKCRKCRKRMKEWLSELGELISDIPEKVEKQAIEPITSDIKQLFPSHLRHYIDLIFFIAIGVFLIFVLDTFVRLGKSFSRRRK